MFNPEVIREVYRSGNIKLTLAQLVALEQRLTALFHHAEAPVRAMVLGLAMGESVLFVGPPGVAKSKLISSLCELTGIKRPLAELAGGGDAGERQDGGYFEYLLTPFTEPSELFGSLKIEDFGKSSDRLTRHEAGMIHRSRIVFLDEVFNGSSAILNSLLALMNERRFHDRGLVKRAMLETLFGATNAIPTKQELRAAYDRFVFRVHVDVVEVSQVPLRMLLERAWRLPETLPVDGALHGLFEGMSALRTEIRRNRERLFQADDNDPDVRLLTLLLNMAHSLAGQEFSNRRIVKLTEAMVYARLLRLQREGGDGDGRLGIDEFELAWLFFLDDPRKGVEHAGKFANRLLTEVPGGLA